MPSTVIINGRGLGHGLGMSQWGAQGMAADGRTFDEILRHYYTGIELRQYAGFDG
jgi:stage II sporulation protein D